MQVLLKAEGRIWLDAGQGPFLGYGRKELLKNIYETGSLIAAAAVMKMSYRQAWAHVNSINQAMPENIVVAQRGGREGGGTIITDKGLEAIHQFEQTEENFRSFLASQNITIHF